MDRYVGEGQMEPGVWEDDIRGREGQRVEEEKVIDDQRERDLVGQVGVVKDLCGCLTFDKH